MPGPSFYLTTLGCKVNQYETQALREAWLAAGLEAADTPEAAGIVVVNSCAVTARAVADVRYIVRRMHRAAPGIPILVTGCAAQVMERELGALPGVCMVVPQEYKEILLSFFFAQRPEELLACPENIRIRIKQLLVARHPGNKHKNTSPDPAKKRPDPLPSPQPEQPCQKETNGAGPRYPAFSIAKYNRSRAVLKIQDGCSHRCTYCIVPVTRGKSRSRLVRDSIEEAGRLLQAGFREIVISGVNLRQYGLDLAPRHDFWDFIATLDRELRGEWQGKMRFRISSLEPGQLGEKALDILRSCKLIAPHLHLSLQSGSPSVLRRMGRGHYDPASVSGFVHSLQDIWPNFALGADILTAFPGETDAEHDETLALCRELPFSYAHVFPYSQRPHTPAASMSGQLTSQVKKQRAKELRECIQAKQHSFLEKALCLPEMWIAPEVATYPYGEDTGQETPDDRDCRFLAGVSEQYITCSMEQGQEPVMDYSFIRVKPVARDGMQLLVARL